MFARLQPRKDWIKQSFLLPAGAHGDRLAKIYRTYTTADAKFTDSTVGGSWALNPLPQYTRFADLPRAAAIGSGYNASGVNIEGVNRSAAMQNINGGMGRVFSEVYDDNARYVHIRCGVAKFNSLTRFFGNFYSVKQATAARTGRMDRGIAGTIIDAGVGLITLPLQPVVLIGKMFRYWLGRPSSKYYYLKPTMEAYWTAASYVVNGIWAGMGSTDLDTASARTRITDEESGGNDVKSDWGILRKLLPDIYGPSGHVDVNAISSKAERLRILFHKRLNKQMKGMNAAQMEEFVLQLGNRDPSKRLYLLDTGDIKPDQSFGQYLTAYINSAVNDTESDKQIEYESTEKDDVDGSEARKELASWSSYTTSKLRDASEFVTFRVNDIGSVSESFSNSTKESGISSTINSMSMTARDKRFNFADGNLVGGLGKVMEWTRDFASNLLESVSLQGIAAVAGSAFTDIPEQWDDSSASFNDMSFTINLRAPYNNPISRLQNIFIPLGCILATALPLSTGQQSFTSPFLVEVISPGQGHIRLGIIDSISITRATGDVKWSSDMHYMGVDVTIGIKDLSKVIHMPILLKPGIVATLGMQMTNAYDKNMAGSGLETNYKGDAANLAATLSENTYNDDSAFGDYLGALASLPFEDYISSVAAFAIRRRREALRFMQAGSDSWQPGVFTRSWVGSGLRALSERSGRG